jgi:hypothetical protein
MGSRRFSRLCTSLRRRRRSSTIIMDLPSAGTCAHSALEVGACASLSVVGPGPVHPQEHGACRQAGGAVDDHPDPGAPRRDVGAPRPGPSPLAAAVVAERIRRDMARRGRAMCVRPLRRHLPSCVSGAWHGHSGTFCGARRYSVSGARTGGERALPTSPSSTATSTR